MVTLYPETSAGKLILCGIPEAEVEALTPHNRTWLVAFLKEFPLTGGDVGAHIKQTTAGLPLRFIYEESSSAGEAK